MDDLLEFLRARLDEREQRARAATPGPWRTEGLPYDETEDDPAVLAADGRWVAGLAYDGLSTSTAHEVDADGVHIADNDPAYVLTDIATKRSILGLAATVTDPNDDEQVWYQQAIGDVIRLMALPHVRAALDEHLTEHGCGTGDHQSRSYVGGFINCPEAKALWDLLPASAQITLG